MKLPSVTRGARLACATTLLFVLSASPALAAGDAAAARTSRHAGKAPAGPSTTFESKRLNLSSSDAVHHASASGIGGSIVRTIVGLLIVIAVIYGLTWIIRQSKASKATATIGDGLEQVAALPLGTGRSVALVRVGDELHLLGVAEHGVTGIRVFSEDEAYELGLPFHADDDDLRGGPVPIQRVVDALRRLTLR